MSTPTNSKENKPPITNEEDVRIKALEAQIEAAKKVLASSMERGCELKRELENKLDCQIKGFQGAYVHDAMRGVCDVPRIITYDGIQAALDHALMCFQAEREKGVPNK